MAVFHTRHRVGPQKIAAFVAVGFVIGSVLGYIFMATVHAVGSVAIDVIIYCNSLVGGMRMARHPCSLSGHARGVAADAGDQSRVALDRRQSGGSSYHRLALCTDNALAASECHDYWASNSLTPTFEQVCPPQQRQRQLPLQQQSSRQRGVQQRRRRRRRLKATQSIRCAPAMAART
jgi:hypothetical protein